MKSVPSQHTKSKKSSYSNQPITRNRPDQAKYSPKTNPNTKNR